MRHVLADHRLDVCCQCGDLFFVDLRREGRRPTLCSPRCAKRWKHLRYEASEAGKAARARQNHVRRMRMRGSQAEVERFSPMEIFHRDGWRCGVCHRKVPRKPFPHPLSATLDHLIPLSEGGPHTRANVRLAHLRCNTERGVGGVDQLRLLGC